MVQEVQWTQAVVQILGILYARDDISKFVLQAHWIWCRVTGGEQNTEPYEVISDTVLFLLETHFKANTWIHCAVEVPLLFKRCYDVYCQSNSQRQKAASVSSMCLDVL